MTLPKVSVIIPAYNNAEFLGEAIQSCLDQTYTNFEIVVVNDASPDDIDEVINQFGDARLKYIVHESNKGLSAARNTGIRASLGEYIALLDGDDIFHPQKLELHVNLLEKYPEIGVTYNSRFELNHSSNTIRELWRPPLIVELTDLVKGFPFSPSDMVLRREWLLRVNLFDENHTYVGEDLDINCRLALKGCKFAGVDRALNYRRYHSGRVIDIRSSLESTILPLQRIFSDPDCPLDVLERKDIALSIHYMLWSIIAFAQGDTDLGQEYCCEAIRLNPPLLIGMPSELLNSIISWSISDDSKDHEEILKGIFEQLPAVVGSLKNQAEWAISRGFLLRLFRAVIWNREGDGKKYFERALALHAKIDQQLIEQWAAQLLDYEHEMGPKSAEKAIQNLYPYIQRLGDQSTVRQFKGQHFITQAFGNYRAGSYSKVPQAVIKALATDLKYLTNKGVVSILVRSITGLRG